VIAGNRDVVVRPGWDYGVAALGSGAHADSEVLVVYQHLSERGITAVAPLEDRFLSDGDRAEVLRAATGERLRRRRDLLLVTLLTLLLTLATLLLSSDRSLATSLPRGGKLLLGVLARQGGRELGALEPAPISDDREPV